jgi:hypothetical protein
MTERMFDLMNVSTGVDGDPRTESQNDDVVLLKIKKIPGVSGESILG